MATETVKVQVTGLAQLKAKVRDSGEPLYGAPMVEAMEMTGYKAEDVARQYAPVRTGRLKGGIRHTLSPVRPLPAWVKIETTARAKSRRYPGGYPYPRLLNYWNRSSRFHWLNNAIEATKPAIEGLLNAVAKAIELKWGSGPIL